MAEPVPSAAPVSSVENYIIEENKKIGKLHERITEVTKERDELETDNGKLEESQRYMRGLLHNYHELGTHYEASQSTLVHFCENVYLDQIALRTVPVFCVVMVFFYGVSVMSGYGFGFISECVISLGVGIGTVLYLRVMKPLLELQQKIRAKEEDIIELKKANDIIPNLLDRI